MSGEHPDRERMIRRMAELKPKLDAMTGPASEDGRGTAEREQAIAHDIVRDWLLACNPDALPQIRFEQSEALQHMIAAALSASREGEGGKIREPMLTVDLETEADNLRLRNERDGALETAAIALEERATKRRAKAERLYSEDLPPIYGAENERAANELDDAAALVRALKRPSPGTDK